ncbi:MAG: histidine phosphatase family protein [Mycobacterium sp.]|nr:histidine phosphatase family protein [Mycobacterium sp.]
MVTATFMLVSSAFAAWAANNITITFVRHGESQGNVSCCIDTTIPGPNLTANGQAQAQARAQQLATDGVPYDGIYYSDMVRTQQTAAPFAALTGLPETELAGLHEVQAGIYEGAPQNSGFERILYALTALAWTTGLYGVPMPGSADLTGANFESRFSGAVQAMYDSGDKNPVAFAHGLSIMAWTLMNVDNPDLSLLLGHPLGNTAVVTVTGNPTDGWTLVNWDGTAVTQNPALPTKLFVDVRNMITVPQMAVYNVVQAFGTGNLSTIANAVRDGVFNSVQAVVNFPVAVVKSVIQSIQTGTVFQAAPPPAPAPAAAAPAAALASNETPSGSNTDKPGVTALSAKKVTTPLSDNKSATASTPVAEQTPVTGTAAKDEPKSDPKTDTKQSTPSGDAASNPAQPAKDSSSTAGQQKSDDTPKSATTGKPKAGTADSDSTKSDKSASGTSKSSADKSDKSASDKTKATADSADKPKKADKPKTDTGSGHSSPAGSGAAAGSSHDAK